MVRKIRPIARATIAAVLVFGLAGCAAGRADSRLVELRPEIDDSKDGAILPIVVRTEMRDGVSLSGNLYLPDHDGSFPCILIRTPYGKDGALSEPENVSRYVQSGYAYLIQDVRGKGESEGRYIPFENDAFDGYDTIEWMALQSWCNGEIGMTGASAMGYASLLAATMNPPHLKAAFVAVAPSTRLTGAFVGGAYKSQDAGDWNRDQGISEEEIGKEAASYPASSYWDRTEIGDHRKYIEIPIYHYGGWYDIFNEGAVRNFEYLQHSGTLAARGNQRLEMGPFAHRELTADFHYPDGERQRNHPLELQWFDHWLKGDQNGLFDAAPVKVYLMAAARAGSVSSKNRWIEFDDWPPRVTMTSYYLRSGGGLSTAPPDCESCGKAYVFDPSDPVPTLGGANLTFDRGPMDQRAIGDRQDYLRFETAPLTEDVAIAGPVTMKLWASTDGRDTDFMVKVVDVYPDGYEAVVLDSALRTRYRHGRMPNEIAWMTPGVPEKMMIDLWDTALIFEKGHKIAVHVTSSNWPRFDVNPNSGKNPGSDSRARIATNRVYMESGRPSAIELPVIALPE